MTVEWNLIFPGWAIAAILIVGSLLIARWYWVQTAGLRSPWNWLLPLLRSLSFILLVGMLAGPSLTYRLVDGEMSRIALVVDTSASMATPLADQEISRSQAAKMRLLKDADGKWDNSLLNQLSRSHHLSVYSTTGKKLWDSQLAKEPFNDADWSALDHESPLGESIKHLAIMNSPLAEESRIDAASIKATESLAWDAMVVVTDGQSNSGAPLEEIAISSGKRIPIFTLGVGDEEEPADLAILELEASSSVRREDRLRGTIRIKEVMPPGLPYRILIRHLDQILWQQEATSGNRGVYSIPFQFPIETAIDKVAANMPAGFEYRAVPLDMMCSIETDGAELSKKNNQLATSTWGVIRQNQVLLIDPMGGWESRYIRNALERDPSWKVQAHLGPNSLEKRVFPATKHELLEYDLVIASLGALESIPIEARDWMGDYLAFSAGGLIALDSVKSDVQLSPFVAQWLPILERTPNRNPVFVKEISTDAGSASGLRLRLAPVAVEQPAFQFEQERSLNEKIWGRLHAPHTYQDLQLRPGAEPLIEGLDANGASIPLLVTARIGQGRVVYSASDETWRWRYGVSDLYHQRFWNQIAGWVMRQPFMVRGELVALDAGARLHRLSDSLVLRAKILGEDRQPIGLDKVQADLFQGGVRVTSLNLKAKENAPGYFEGNFPLVDIPSLQKTSEGESDLPMGDPQLNEYTLRLLPTGLPEEAKQISTSFWIAEENNREMERVRLNAEALKKSALSTGGEFLPLSQSDALYGMLERFSRGKVETRSYALWQSLPWFMLLMIFLSTEWWLRKKVGLV